jgi:hypothetical protein
MRPAMKTKTRMMTLLILPLWTGCASLVNGLHQSVEVASDRPGATVQIRGYGRQTTPAIFELPRKESEQKITIVSRRPGSDSLDTNRILLEHRISHVVWTNFLIGLWGAPGAGYDFIAGGAWKLVVSPRSRVPDHIHIHVDMDFDPWQTGEWKGSTALVSGFKVYPRDVLPQGRVDGDFAFQVVAAKRTWPLEAEGRVYFYSSLDQTGESVLAEAGVRKTLYDNSAVRPWLSGGLSYLTGSTQEYGGLPLGLWGRLGIDIRMGRTLFFAPYGGYAKHEAVSGGASTAGYTGGLILGVLW